MLAFLAYEKKHLAWSTSTIENYQSAILALFDDKQPITSFCLYQEFFKALNANTLQPSTTQNVDISPVLHHFDHLGGNTTMPAEALRAKLCWLLAVCAFLRPSDIQCIDLDHCHITPSSGDLTLRVIAPKERRQGKRVTKDVVVRRHPTALYCPVAAYTAYCTRLANTPCYCRHPTLSSVTINALVRSLRKPTDPIGSQAISKIIQTIMALIPQAPGQSRPISGCALGSTRAARAGASVNDIVLQGHWSSQAIFNNFYQVASSTQSNFTSLTLDADDQAANTLETQPMDPPLDE
ncbi:hypothetical protein BJV82DRAFT_676807 [Fennellomyces sp. T-0311]|nr:hypothetical protein BJV82DRAFT_676807 [Fennellomyces sp. T-0311]